MDIVLQNLRKEWASYDWDEEIASERSIVRMRQLRGGAQGPASQSIDLWRFAAALMAWKVFQCFSSETSQLTEAQFYAEVDATFSLKYTGAMGAYGAQRHQKVLDACTALNKELNTGLIEAMSIIAWATLEPPVKTSGLSAGSETMRRNARVAHAIQKGRAAFCAAFCSLMVDAIESVGMSGPNSKNSYLPTVALWRMMVDGLGKESPNATKMMPWDFTSFNGGLTEGCEAQPYPTYAVRYLSDEKVPSANPRPVEPIPHVPRDDLYVTAKVADLKDKAVRLATRAFGRLPGALVHMDIDISAHEVAVMCSVIRASTRWTEIKSTRALALDTWASLIRGGRLKLAERSWLAHGLLMGAQMTVMSVSSAELELKEVFMPLFRFSALALSGGTETSNRAAWERLPPGLIEGQFGAEVLNCKLQFLATGEEASTKPWSNAFQEYALYLGMREGEALLNRLDGGKFDLHFGDCVEQEDRRDALLATIGKGPAATKSWFGVAGKAEWLPAPKAIKNWAECSDVQSSETRCDSLAPEPAVATAAAMAGEGPEGWVDDEEDAVIASGSEHEAPEEKLVAKNAAKKALKGRKESRSGPSKKPVTTKKPVGFGEAPYTSTTLKKAAIQGRLALSQIVQLSTADRIIAERLRAANQAAVSGQAQPISVGKPLNLAGLSPAGPVLLNRADATVVCAAKEQNDVNTLTMLCNWIATQPEGLLRALDEDGSLPPEDQRKFEVIKQRLEKLVNESRRLVQQVVQDGQLVDKLVTPSMGNSMVDHAVAAVSGKVPFNGDLQQAADILDVQGDNLVGVVSNTERLMFVGGRALQSERALRAFGAKPGASNGLVTRLDRACRTGKLSLEIHDLSPDSHDGKYGCHTYRGLDCVPVPEADENCRYIFSRQDGCYYKHRK